MSFKRTSALCIDISKNYILGFRPYSNKVIEILSSMQRPIDKHIQEAQKQRKMIKERGSKYSPSVVTLQVLGSGAIGCPKSIFIFTDQSRYLFNCGEGTQRLAHEHKMRLARLEHIFFTSASWRNMGGLPGVALTLQDTGVPKIILHGPPDLDELFKATRRFVILKDMKIEMANCSVDNVYDDPVMTIKYIPLLKKINCPSTSDVDLNESCQNIEPDNTDYYAHEISTSTHSRRFQEISNVEVDKYHSGLRNLQNSNIDDLLNEPTKEQVCSMAYICRIKPCLGTLDLQKCVEKGVKPGPNLGLLKNGQDVTLPNGNVVYARDVRTPDDPGPVFIVIDVPHVDFLDSLVTSKEFSIHQEQRNMNLEDCPSVIIHFTPDEIIKCELYQHFMKSFPKETKHLVLNESNTCPGSIAITRIQSKLNLLDNNIFPILKANITPSDKTSKDMAENLLNEINNISDGLLVSHLKTQLNLNSDVHEDTVEETSNIVPVKTFTAYHLRPKKGLDRSTELKSNNVEYIGETLLYPGFINCLQNIYSKKSQLKLPSSQKYPKIVFFGTGSCIPNKTRNTSCIMVHVDEGNSIILDCGEGSFGQIARYYGKEGMFNIMKNLKAIYLSHLHADHHLGLIGILQGRREILKSFGDENIKPVYLLAPKQIMRWLWLYHKRFERIMHEFKLIPNSSLCINSSDYENLSKNILNSIGLESVETCPVQHCPNSFGISFNTVNSKKITYSGDTMPCVELTKIGINSDLLIHEATMEDALAGEARYKMHSTVSQAVNIGKEMKAKFTLLTHFSQRYARVPILPAEVETSGKDVGVAFDNMEVTFDDLPLLPQLYPALKLMFADHFEDLENRAIKRALKRERAQSPVVLTKLQSRSISSHQVAKKQTPDSSPTAD